MFKALSLVAASVALFAGSPVHATPAKTAATMACCTGTCCDKPCCVGGCACDDCKTCCGACCE